MKWDMQMVPMIQTKEMIGITKLVVEPIGNHYRIVIKGSNEPTRPILYSSDLPLQTMEEICLVMENRYKQIYDEGFAEGYRQGWDDCLVTEADK